MSDPLPAASPGLAAWGAAALCGLAVLLTVLAALLERSGPIRLRAWTHEAGGRLQALYEAPSRFEAFRFLLSFTAKAMPILVFLAVLPPARAWLGAAGPGLALGFALALLGAAELSNRSLVARDPEAALRRMTPVYRGLHGLLRPFVAALAPLFPDRPPEAEDASGGEEEVSDEEVEAYIRVGAHEGILEPGQEALVRGIVEFAGTTVRSVMTPRIDVVGAPVESDLQALARLFLDARHSRLPLFRGSIDQVVGTLHIRDLLGALRGATQASAADLVKPAYFVPETKRLDLLLRELQARHLQLAIVVDEYGGTAGLVTIEDLLEEIVGDIPDEDEEGVMVHQALGEGRWRFDGRSHLEDLEGVFGVDLDEAGYETVGGLLFGVLGAVPREGESVEAFGLRLTAERVADRRVLSVLVEAAAGAAHEERVDG